MFSAGMRRNKNRETPYSEEEHMCYAARVASSPGDVSIGILPRWVMIVALAFLMVGIAG